jgi:serine/threonine-protein kinase
MTEPDAADWERLELLFEAAVTLPPAERAAFLDRETLPAHLRAELESLLSSAEPADRLFDRLAAGLDSLSSVDDDDPPSCDPMVARRVGRYLVEERIGGGGMGVIYRAWDTALQRDVALKFLPPYLGLDERAKARFLVEARAAAALDHPAICTVHEIGESEDGRLFIAMPCYQGETLKERIARGPLAIVDAAGIAASIAAGLAAAHSRGIIHRDVKPANVMLTREGGVKLLDFGLAKIADATITTPGLTPGTVAYMSPEQASGQSVTVCSDLWSLGVVWYEMLTGRRPFRGGSEGAIIESILHDEPEPLQAVRPDVPVPIARIVERLLRKDPSARHASADEVLAELNRGRAATSQPDRRASAPAAASPSRLQRWARSVLGAVIIAAAAISVGSLYSSRSGPRAPTGGGMVPDAQRTIAVLPFVNVGGEPENDYFSDGLTEELIATLSRLGAVRVAARTSVFALKGDRRDIREIGRALGVGAILEGSVRRQGDRIRVVARLVGVADGFQLWSASYERGMTDLLAIESDIALRITNALVAELTPADSARLARQPTSSAEAHTLYLKGRYFWHRRSRHGFEKALDYFQQALKVDSQYALAHAGLAGAYAPLGVFGYIQPPVARERMRAAAYRAVELDGGLAEAHTALAAYLNIHEWDPVGAEREFLRAIELDPDYPTAHHWYGYFLSGQGRFDEALAQQRIAVALDPLAPVHTASLAFTLLATGQPDSAVDRFQEVLDLDPGFWLADEGLGMLYEALGKREEAVRAFENAATHAGPARRPRAALARVLVLVGRTREARRLVDTLVAEGTRDSIYTPELASALYALGDTAAAFTWLEAAYRQRHPDFQHATLRLGFSGIERTARFREVMQRTGFPAADWASAARRGR